MSRDRTAALGEWLAGGARQMGEVLIQRSREATTYTLCHVEDAPGTDLPPETESRRARDLALSSESGEYRPLKTAPNLRRGWRLELGSLEEVRQALDFFYPAMLGALFDHEQGRLSAMPLRETLARQSGMYAVTRKLTDTQAQELIGSLCRSDCGCLKTILWPIAPGLRIETLPRGKFDPAASQCACAAAPGLPMFCQEACNLLVAKAREVVKATPAAQPAAP